VAEPLLSVQDLTVEFGRGKSAVQAVDHVSFEVARGTTVGLVGESGSGKSATALSLLRLLPSPPARVVSGSAYLEGRDLLALSESELRKQRGGTVGFVFQDPLTSLNPVMTVGEQVAEAIRLHTSARRRQAWDRAVEALDRVHIPNAPQRARDYPHQFSGGMRQRVMIAMALASRPKLLLADEPTTALDVTIQAEILDLLSELRQTLGLAILLITHDLGVVSEVCQDVLVMYAGQIVERGPAAELFTSPKHPYTQGLLASLPQVTEGEQLRLQAIQGAPPSLSEPPSGCRFHPRCPKAFAECRVTEPTEVQFSSTRAARCLLYGGGQPEEQLGVPETGSSEWGRPPQRPSMWQ
jgi:oligopeptide/dipeptide ABC transporter ATP-binding protein